MVSPKGFAHPEVPVKQAAWLRVVDTTPEAPLGTRLEIRYLDSGGQFRNLPGAPCAHARSTCEFWMRLDTPGVLEVKAVAVWLGEDQYSSEVVDVTWVPTLKKLSFDYTVPPRLERKATGPVEYINGGQQAQPDYWPVDLTVKKCPPRDKNSYHWAYTPPGGTDVVNLPTHWASGCTWRARFPGPGAGKGSGEGMFQVSLQVDGQQRQKYEGKRAVLLQDFLVLGLGDSLGSGEGNPPWTSGQCDRSALSYQALAAFDLQSADKTQKTSVTFVHLACSGASIKDHSNTGSNGGLLDPYVGMNYTSVGQAGLPSQLEQAKTLIGTREVDAVLLSAGVNDLEFGNVMSTSCAHWSLKPELITSNCFDQPYTDTTGQVNTTLRGFLQQRLGLLPNLYQQLKDGLKNTFGSSSWVFPSKRILITEYPNTLHNEQGQLCPGLNLDAPGSVFVPGGNHDGWTTANEVVTLENEFLTPLNTAIAATATLPDPWTVVSLAGPFAQRGYCANPSWVVTRFQSFAGQGNANGTLHPNNAGHAWISTVVFNALKAQLLPGGVPRKPRT